jgi:hypothetical protein
MTGKLKQWAILVGGLMGAMAATAAMPKPNHAQTNSKFYCGDLNGKPATYVRGRRGPVPIIHWVDESFPPPWNPQRRCQEVSARFQRFYDNGQLDYLKAGKFNGQSVLCITRTQPGECIPGGLLITLKPETDPKLTLQRLLDFRVEGSGVPIRLNTKEKEPTFNTNKEQIFYTNDEAYLDMRKFLGEDEQNDGQLW